MTFIRARLTVPAHVTPLTNLPDLEFEVIATSEIGGRAALREAWEAYATSARSSKTWDAVAREIEMTPIKIGDVTMEAR